MQIAPVSNFNYQTKLRTNRSNFKNSYSEESAKTDTTQSNEVNFKGRCSITFAALGTTLGFIFGPAGAALGTYVGHRLGDKIDKDAEEVEKRDDYFGSEDTDPYHMRGKF